MKHFTLIGILGLLAGCSSLCLAQPLNPDPGFETGQSGWGKPFVPADSQNRGCTLAFSAEDPHAGNLCAVMSSESDSRFAITPKGGTINVLPGQTYAISIWSKAGADFKIHPKTPGFIIRVDMLKGTQQVESLYIDASGKVSGTIGHDGPVIPDSWTQVKGQVSVPDGTSRMRVNIFFWRASGHLYLDDMAINPVND
ncbi:hypothetical protein H5P28_16785 [Ruficoccus amylovorans]|uniref:CBM-cenC domain-containing protein n=1 Tax=Ruficoccus amylovorans TaxID=1804625 RepID=A0A842HHC1_9BACT|nr:hypothetical protein [Ruficoccus amylovorans]MBC2595923.1 hypothetical protein [Ruficoccus amylovorans]